MTYPAHSFSELTKISEHSFSTLCQNKITGEKSLLSAIAIKAGTIFASFEAANILAAPNKYTLQVNENTHIILSPDVLQFVNHSCNPNVFFDTTTFELSALRDIVKGDEFTFFYPSTEWNMESPFNCSCGENNCLHTIKGASVLSAETISRYRFTDFISKKLNIPHLQLI
jgi:hypothetical protein